VCSQSLQAPFRCRRRRRRPLRASVCLQTKRLSLPRLRRGLSGALDVAVGELMAPTAPCVRGFGTLRPHGGGNISLKSRKSDKTTFRNMIRKSEFSQMANTCFSDWARRADPSSASNTPRSEGAALRVQDAVPQRKRESPRRQRHRCALRLFCEECAHLESEPSRLAAQRTRPNTRTGYKAAFTRASQPLRRSSA
jgi:hypothetical protein